MPRIVYQDELITEYADGTEEVRFTSDEWAHMAAHPVAFGLALACGHAPSDYSPAEGCIVCFNEQEAQA